jgi:hypothetical protein
VDGLDDIVDTVVIGSRGRVVAAVLNSKAVLVVKLWSRY